jgi:hypothetical protein
MAAIRKFLAGEIDAKGPRSTVDAYVRTVVRPDGTRYLYLYNYAEGAGPDSGKTPSQSLHFDYVSAKAFRAILDETFGPLL